MNAAAKVKRSSQENTGGLQKRFMNTDHDLRLVGVGALPLYPKTARCAPVSPTALSVRRSRERGSGRLTWSSFASPLSADDAPWPEMSPEIRAERLYP